MDLFNMYSSHTGRKPLRLTQGKPKFFVGFFIFVFIATMTIQPLVFRANAGVGTIDIENLNGSGNGPYDAFGTWSSTGGQPCYNQGGQGGDGQFRYSIKVFENTNGGNPIVFDSGIDTILQSINPAPCAGGIFENPGNGHLTASNEAWPATANGQTPTPATFNLSAGSHSICAVLIHVNDNGQDQVGDPVCLDSPVVIYTLTYIAGPNGSITGISPQSVNAGEDGTTVTAIADTGYHFVDWNDGSTVATRTETNVTVNMSFTANFAQDDVATHTLTYTAGPNGSVTGTSPQTVNDGADGTAVTAVADSGYHFVNWDDSSTDNPRTDTNVQNDLTTTANFAINQYTLTYNAGANGSVTGTSPQTVNAGADGAQVTAVADSGYHFLNWSDGGLTASRTETSVNADLTVTANFEADEQEVIQYILSYIAGSNGSISGTTPQTVNAGSDGTAVTAVPDSGYHFLNWNDGILTASRTETNVSDNLTVTANFEADEQEVITHTLNVTISNESGDGEGSVTDNAPQINCDSLNGESDCSGTYSSGTDVTLTATAHEGSSFEGSWTSGPCTGSNNPVCVVNMGSNQTINAHFSLNTVVSPSPTPEPNPTPTPSPEPTPTPTPTSNGGGGGGGSGPQGDFINGPLANPPAVAGAATIAPPQVQGAMTVLPATGASTFDRMLLSLFAALMLTGALMLLTGYGMLPKAILRKIR